MNFFAVKVGACFVAGGSAVQAPTLLVSIVVSLDKALHRTCLLVMVKRPPAASVPQLCLHQCAQGQQCSL